METLSRVPLTPRRPGIGVQELPTRNRVLVVDDDKSVREFFQRTLLFGGIDVIVASGGAEGLRLLRTDPRVGLVLLDLDMPQVDGRRFRESQRADPDLAAIRTIVVTGTRLTDDTRRELDALEYVIKPVTPTQLLYIVDRHLPKIDLVTTSST